MRKYLKRFVSWLLIATMILGSNTVTALAEELSDGFTSEEIIYEEPIESSYEEPTVEEVGEIFISSDDFSSVEIIDEQNIIEEISNELVEVIDTPTVELTAEPTEVPTVEPTVEPTNVPTAEPTVAPTAEPTVEPTEAPTAELTETPPPVFEQGYIRVSGGTSVYKAVNGKEAGQFLNDVYVYGVVEHRAEEITEDWLKITFDTAYNRENGIALYEGYVRGNRVKTLSQEEADDLYNRAAYEANVRSYRNLYLPAAQYEEYTTKEAEDIVVDEAATEEVVVIEGALDEQAPVEEAAPFESGYVRITAGTTVYSSANKDDELGTVDADAVVYASEVIRDTDGNITWVHIVFDTTEEKTVNGYAVGASATILNGENEVSIVSFTFKEAAILERKNVTVPADTAVYAQASTEDILGTITETATVYILEVVENGSDVWMKVSFAAESGETVEGYVLYNETMELSTEGGSTVVKIQKAEAEAIDKGYVRLSAGTVVYTTEECDEELGTVDEDAIVYAEIANEGIYKVYFDTEDGSAYVGFVKSEGIAFLSAEEATGITGREYNGFFMPVILFTGKINGLTDGLWVYEVVDEYAKVLGYLDYDVTSLSIPDQLGGYYVNAIGEKAFVKNTALTSMYIHGNVISIADDAFASKDVTLSGYNGTKALAYAKDHEIPRENRTNIDYFEVQQHVIDYSYADNSRFTYVSENTIHMNKAESRVLSVGSYFYIPERYGELVAFYKVEGIKPAEGYSIITVSEAVADEVLTRMHIEDMTLYADWSNGEWVDGVEIITEKFDAHASSGINTYLKYEKGPLSVILSGGISTKFDFDLRVIPWALEEFSLRLEPTFTLTGKLSADTDFGNDKKDSMTTQYTSVKKDGSPVEIYLGKLPLVSLAGVVNVSAGVYLKTELSGEITVTLKLNGKYGFKYNKATQKLEGIHDVKVTWPPEVEAQGELLIGPAEAVSLELAVLGKVASVDFFQGVDITLSWALEHPECFDATFGYTITCDMNISNDKLGKLIKGLSTGVKRNFFTATGNLGHLHYEVGRGFMLRCTYEDSCNVSFNSGTSTKLQPQQVKYNTTITEPDLEIAGQKPEGWYTDKAFNNPWNFATDKVTHDMTLYAKWNLQTEEVIYHQGVVDKAHSVSENTIVRENAYVGALISKPEDPMHPNYRFRGWYEDSKFTTEMDFDTKLMPDVPLDLYAKWEYEEGYDPYQISTGGGSSGSDITHGIGYDVEFNGHKYKHIMTYLTYDAAQQYAKDHGGYLLTINSAQEQDLLYNYVNNDCAQEFLWLGMRSSGNWQYWDYTQEGVNYSNWENGYPQAGTSNAVIRRVGSKWETLSNDATAHFVVEWGGTSASTGQAVTTGVQYTKNAFTKTARVTGYSGNDTALIIESKYEGYDVTEIESSAFKGNTNLESIEIPSSITKIGHDAFNGCTSLKNISIPDSVTEVGEKCFYNCSSLQNVIWSSNAKTIRKSLFEEAKNLVKITNIDAVTKIEERAFYDCTSLKNIVFPSSLTSIGSYGFYNCKSLPDIVLPDTVSTVGGSAFRNCTSAKVIIPAGSMDILDNYMFAGCTGATDVYIPATILRIATSYDPFSSVTKATFHVYKGTEGYSWANSKRSGYVDEIGSSYRVQFVTYTDGGASSSGVKDGSTTDVMYIAAGQRIAEPAIEVDGKVIVGWYLDPEFKKKWDFATDKMPEGNITLYAKWVESSEAFDFDVVNGNAKITSYNGNNYNVVIPSMIKGYPVTVLAENSIVNNSIGYLTIPETVKTIENGAIDCPNLLGVTVSGDKYYKVDSEGVLYSASGKYLIFAPQGRKLLSYEIPSGTTKIYKRAFSGQTSLNRIYIPESVTSIDAEAFPGLYHLVIYGPITTCAAKTFANKYFYAYNEYKVYYYNGNEMLYDATITAGNLIEDHYKPITDFETFAGWYKDEAFSQVWNFETDTMPENDINLYLKWNSLFSVMVNGNNVTITGYSGDASDIIIPAEINGYEVNKIAFNAITSNAISSVTIPNTVVEIEEGAIADHVKVIAAKDSVAHQYALNYGLTFNVKKYNIFFEEYGGSEVNDLAVEPGKTTKLPTPIRDNYIFGGWFTDTGYSTEWTSETVMPEEDVTLHAQWKITSNNVLDSFSYVILNDGTVEITGYTGDKVVLTIPSTINGYIVTRIGSHAFEANSYAIRITLPTTVTSIGDYAFANSAVRTVKGMKNVNTIGDAAFMDCAGLSSIDSVSSLTTIGDSAFRGTGLTEFKAPKKLLAIGENAFYDCEYLDTLTLNAELTSLGKGAFVKCPRLLQASIPTMVKKDAELAFDSTCELTYTGSNNITILDWSVKNGTYVTISWNGVKGATQYVLARKTETVTKLTRWSTYYTSGIRQATVNAGKLGQTAEIVVIACDENKKAIAQSEPITVYLSTIATPSIVSVAQTGDQTAQMTIERVSGANGYEIERTNEPDGTFTFLKKVTVSSFENSGLMPGQDYYYRIRAYKTEDGVKTYSRYSDVFYFHMPYKFVSAPKNVVARQSAAKEIQVTWDPVKGAEGYIVYRSMKGGEFTQFAETLSPAYTNTKVVVGRDYAYKICAYFTEQGERIVSEESAAVPITVQSIPTPLITKVTQFRSSVVKVKWSSVSDAVGYMLYRSDSIDGTYKRVKTVTTTEANDLSSVTFGNTYYYKVCAYKLDDEGNQIIGEMSPAVALTINTVPVIEGLSATQSTATGVRASWNAISGVSGYELWISANNKNNFELYTTATGKTADVSGLQDGVTYYLKVRGFVADDSGTAYGLYSDVVPVTILGAPDIQVLEQEGTKTARIIWTKVDSAEGYEVWRQDGTTATYKLWRTLTGTTALNTSLAYNTIYGYKVRSYKTIDGVKQYSPYSEIKKIRLLDAPTLSKVERTSTRTVTLNWTAVTGAQGYDVYRSTEANGVFKLWKTIDGLTATNTSLTVGASYFYKVVPYSELNGEKQQGKPSAIKGICMLPTPSITSIENASSTSVKVSWNEVEGATGYKLLRDTTENGSYGTVKKVTTLNTTSLNLTENTQYYFKVVAYVVIDGVTYESLPSAVSSVYFINLAKPSFKSLEQPTPVSVFLSWGAISGAAGYELVRSDSIDGPYKTVKTVTETSATNTSLKAGGTYYYKVRAYKEISSTEKAYGLFSNPIAITLMAAPKITSVDRIGNSSAKITWTAVDNATGYKLYRSTEVNGTYKLLKTVTDTTYSNGGLSSGTQYYYKVSAINESDGITKIGPKSASGNVLINDLTYTKITGFVQNGDGTVTLKWKAIDDAEGYEVQKSEADGAFSKVKNTSASGTTITGLTNGNTYSFRVRMYKTVDGSKQYGGFSTSVSVTLMNAPTITSAAHTSPTEVVVNWNAVDNATNYKVYQKVEGGSYKLVGTVTDTTLTCSGLSKGKLYTYKVVAVRTTTSQTNISGYSDEYIAYILECAHPYANNMNQSWSYTLSGASNLEIKFTSSTQFESGYDKLYITDADGNSVGSSPYSGTSLAGVVVTVPGDTVNLRMTSDRSVTYYGFAVEYIKAVD